MQMQMEVAINDIGYDFRLYALDLERIAANYLNAEFTIRKAVSIEIGVSKICVDKFGKDYCGLRNFANFVK